MISWQLTSSDPAAPRFLEPHDLAVSKLGAARAKDLEFVDALITARLLDVKTLRERCALLGDEHAVVRGRIETLLASYLP